VTERPNINKLGPAECPVLLQLVHEYRCSCRGLFVSIKCCLLLAEVFTLHLAPAEKTSSE